MDPSIPSSLPSPLSSPGAEDGFEFCVRGKVGTGNEEEEGRVLEIEITIDPNSYPEGHVPEDLAVILQLQALDPGSDLNRKIEEHFGGIVDGKTFRFDLLSSALSLLLELDLWQVG